MNSKDDPLRDSVLIENREWITCHLDATLAELRAHVERALGQCFWFVLHGNEEISLRSNLPEPLAFELRLWPDDDAELGRPPRFSDRLGPLVRHLTHVIRFQSWVGPAYRLAALLEAAPADPAPRDEDRADSPGTPAPPEDGRAFDVANIVNDFDVHRVVAVRRDGEALSDAAAVWDYTLPDHPESGVLPLGPPDSRSRPNLFRVDLKSAGGDRSFTARTVPAS